MAFLYCAGAVPFYRPFAEKGVLCAVSTRAGGVSKDHLASLNLGLSVGDTPQNVRENLARFARAAGFCAEKTVYTKQEHTDVVVRVDEKNAGMGVWRERFPFGVDGLVTRTPHLPLLAYFADCLPVLFYDSITRAVGICHSGWRGTVLEIAKKTVQKMQTEFGTEPQNVCAAIGPGIGKCCFLVDAPVYEAFYHAFPEQNGYAEKTGEKYKIDLAAAVEGSLRAAGVTKIIKADLCTACEKDTFFSHRASGGKRGLFAAVICLTEEGGVTC